MAQSSLSLTSVLLWLLRFRQGAVVFVVLYRMVFIDDLVFTPSPMLNVSLRSQINASSGKRSQPDFLELCTGDDHLLLDGPLGFLLSITTKIENCATYKDTEVCMYFDSTYSDTCQQRKCYNVEDFNQ